MSRGLLIALLFAFALGVPRDTSAEATTTSWCAAQPRVAENVPSLSSDVVPLVARDDAIRTAMRFAGSRDVALCSIRLGVHDGFLQEKPLVWVVDVDAANLEPLGGSLKWTDIPNGRSPCDDLRISDDAGHHRRVGRPSDSSALNFSEFVPPLHARDRARARSPPAIAGHLVAPARLAASLVVARAPTALNAP